MLKNEDIIDDGFRKKEKIKTSNGKKDTIF